MAWKCNDKAYSYYYYKTLKMGKSFLHGLNLRRFFILIPNHIGIIQFAFSQEKCSPYKINKLVDGNTFWVKKGIGEMRGCT